MAGARKTSVSAPVSAGRSARYPILYKGLRGSCSRVRTFSRKGLSGRPQGRPFAEHQLLLFERADPFLIGGDDRFSVRVDQAVEQLSDLPVKLGDPGSVEGRLLFAAREAVIPDIAEDAPCGGELPLRRDDAVEEIRKRALKLIPQSGSAQGAPADRVQVIEAATQQQSSDASPN